MTAGFSALEQQALVSIIKFLMSVVSRLAGGYHPVKQQLARVSGLLDVLCNGQIADEEEQQPPWRQADALTQMLLGTIKAPVKRDGEMVAETFAHLDYGTAGFLLPPRSSSQRRLDAGVDSAQVGSSEVGPECSETGVGLCEGRLRLRAGDQTGPVGCGWADPGADRQGGGGSADCWQQKVEPAGRDNVVPCEVEWLDELEGETWTQAIARGAGLEVQVRHLIGQVPGWYPTWSQLDTVLCCDGKLDR